MKKYLVSCFAFLLLVVAIPSSYGQDAGFGFSNQWGASGGLGNIFSSPGTQDLGSFNSLRLSDFDPAVKDGLSAFDKFFNSFLDEADRSARLDPFISPFIISEEDGDVIVEVQVDPGTEFEHITVTRRGDLLSINVQKTEVTEDAGGTYTTHIEWSREFFTRSEPLPGEVQEGEMTTDYKDEILRMVFPKSE